MIVLTVTGRIRKVETIENERGAQHKLILDCAQKRWDKDSRAMLTKKAVIALRLWGKTVDEAKGLPTGTLISVRGDVESRAYQEKWYTDASAQEIVVIEGAEREPGQDDLF